MIAETVILFSTQEEALRYRKKCALSCDDALLGVTATTPESLVQELWDVWGTRERIVSAAQRTMIVNALLEQQDAWVRSAGTVSLLAGFLRDFVTFVGSDLCAAHEANFTPSDHEIVAFVRSYEAELGQAGLIESAQAVQRLASVVHIPEVVVRTQQPLPAYMADFLCQVADSYDESNPQLGIDAPVATAAATAGEGASVSTLPDELVYELLKPKGQTAAASMVCEALSKLGEGGKALVTAPDSHALFTTLKDSLVKKGFTVSVKATRSFSATQFGCAFDAVALLCDLEENASLETLLQASATYIESPLSQLMPVQRMRLLRAIRADRTLSAFEIRDALRTASRPFEYFEALVEDSDADVLFGFFEDLVHRVDLDASEVSCELTAITHMKGLYREARRLDVPPRSFFDLVKGITVPYERAVSPDAPGIGGAEVEASVPLVPFAEDKDVARGCVLITSLEDAASYPAKCCDLVVMTSLDNAYYSGAERRSTLTEFLQRYGLPYVDRTLANMEQAFARAARASRARVVFEYAAQNLAGDECYPAFFLESFLKARQIAKREIKPQSIGEDRFDTTARLEEPDPSSAHREPLASRGELSPVERTQLLTYAPDTEGVERPVLSPSSLELYRKCPYRWFVERKLHLDDEGEEFGPLEKGTFAHSVFQAFYEQWATSGHARVTPENYREARELFGQVFDQLLEQQEELEPGERYVAISELEREEVAHLKRQLLDSLELQQHIFPHYQVRGHEVVLSSDEKIAYAGAIIHGRVDRIDVDDQGNCIVIDYKGSPCNHEAGFVMPDEDGEEEAYDAPDKVQALMYAQALRRQDPTLHPKAAVYLSYRASALKDMLVGSVVEALPESGSHTKKNSVVEGNFESYLDRVEAALVPTVERMKSGDIAPDPRNEHACAYCPVLYCEKRIHGSK